MSERAKSSETLSQTIHSPNNLEYTLNRARVCLKAYYDPSMTDADRAEMLDIYGKALTPFPQWAVAKAFDEWEAAETHRPSPGHLVALAKKFVKRITDELAHRAKLEAPEDGEHVRTDSERAKAIEAMLKAGFTDKRFDAVKRKRMARSEAELYEGGINERVPHWSEGVAADSPQMEALRKARAANPIMAEALRSTKLGGSE